jgi:hypothetical protein
MYPTAAPLVALVGIPAIAGLMLGLLVLALRRAARADGAAPRAVSRRTLTVSIVFVVWVALWGAVASTGVLRRTDVLPPPMLPMFLLIFGSAALLAWSRWGTALARHLPLAVLVGAQAFRLPLELAMHEAGRAGVMPVQLSFSGMNFDIVTGASAAILAVLLAKRRAPRWLVVAWNVYGLAMLAIIAGIAVATSPFVRAFGEGSVNTWVTYVPFVWLPAVLVPFALAGHIVVLRRLAMDRRALPRGGPAAQSDLKPMRA